MSLWASDFFCLFYFLCECLCLIFYLLLCVIPEATKWTVNLELRLVSCWPAPHASGQTAGPRNWSQRAAVLTSGMALWSFSPCTCNHIHLKGEQTQEEHKTELKLLKCNGRCCKNINNHLISICVHACTCRQRPVKTCFYTHLHKGMPKGPSGLQSVA